MPNLRICGYLPDSIMNGEENDFENGRISDFQGLVTLTLDRGILHTIIHHSSTSTYIPNFIEIKETSCGRMDRRTDGWTFETGFIRLTQRSRPKNNYQTFNPTIKIKPFYMKLIKLDKKNIQTIQATKISL